MGPPGGLKWPVGDYGGVGGHSVAPPSPEIGPSGHGPSRSKTAFDTLSQMRQNQGRLPSRYTLTIRPKFSQADVDVTAPLEPVKAAKRKPYGLLMALAALLAVALLGLRALEKPGLTATETTLPQTPRAEETAKPLSYLPTGSKVDQSLELSKGSEASLVTGQAPKPHAPPKPVPTPRPKVPPAPPRVPPKLPQLPAASDYPQFEHKDPPVTQKPVPRRCAISCRARSTRSSSHEAMERIG